MKKDRRSAAFFRFIQLVLLFNDDLLGYHLATDDTDEIQSSGQVADVDGGLLVHHEAAHLHTLCVSDVDAELAQLIIGGDGHLVLHGVGRNGHRERVFLEVRILLDAYQGAFAVGTAHYHAADPQNGIIRVGALDAGILTVVAVGVIGMALVEIGWVKLVEEMGTAVGEVFR